MLLWILAIPYYICFLFFYNSRCVLGAGAVTATPTATATATAATSTSTNNITLLDNSTSIAFSPGWELAFFPNPQNGTFAFTNGLDGFIVAVLPVNTVAFSYVGFRRSTGAHYLVCLDCNGSNSSAGLMETVDANDAVEGEDEVPVPLFTFSDLDPTTSHTLEVYNLPDVRFGNTSQLTFVSLEVTTSTFASIEPTSFSAVVPTSTTTTSSTTSTSSTSTTSSTSSASTATSTTTQNNTTSRTLSTSLIAVIAILSLLAVLSLVLGLLVLSRTRRRRKSQLLPGRRFEEGRMSQVTPFSNNNAHDNNNPYSPINARLGRDSLPIASIYETGGALPPGAFRSSSSPQPLQRPISAAQRQGRPPSRPVNPYSAVYPSNLPLEAPSRYDYGYYAPGNDNDYRINGADIGESPAPSSRSYSPGGGGGSIGGSRERLPQQRRPRLDAYGRTASNQTWVSRTPRQ